VFPSVAPMCPERHLDAAELLGSEVRNPKKADAGKITADVMRKYMEDVSKTQSITKSHLGGHRGAY
jgi:hydroxyacid-oxoacid transhydrogenase